MGFRSFGFSPACHPSYRVFRLFPWWVCSPTEDCASLCWSHDNTMAPHDTMPTPSRIGQRSIWEFGTPFWSFSNQLFWSFSTPALGDPRVLEIEGSEVASIP